ncbi:hypothetical protein E2542_SST29911 [Spatholobus suberectus]|nr:hypothetical protein E2542_SST29911 [Spatholobus suberectus]
MQRSRFKPVNKIFQALYCTCSVWNWRGYSIRYQHSGNNGPALVLVHDKPNPRQIRDLSFYTFETWATQLNEFCLDVIKDEAFFICNSIGGVVGLQAAVCYHDTSKVTDELVQIILGPGLEPGAAEVFLEFICYSGGPLPEELLPQVKDEAPHLVNPLVESFVARHAKSSSSTSHC